MVRAERQLGRGHSRSRPQWMSLVHARYRPTRCAAAADAGPMTNVDSENMAVEDQQPDGRRAVASRPMDWWQPSNWRLRPPGQFPITSLFGEGALHRRG